MIHMKHWRLLVLLICFGHGMDLGNWVVKGEGIETRDNIKAARQEQVNKGKRSKVCTYGKYIQIILLLFAPHVKHLDCCKNCRFIEMGVTRRV